MKSNTTMLGLARAKAYAKDIQEIKLNGDICIIGYALTLKELAHLYKENGFTGAGVAQRHLQIWKSLGLVKTYYNDVIIVVIPLPTDCEQVTNLVLAQRERGSSAVAILPQAEASA